MKTLALKGNATPSTSSQTSFNKKGEGSFLSSTNKVEHPFSSPNPGIQRDPIGSSFSGGHNFANIPIFPSRLQPVIQPKLTINEPGDKYEQEADAMAERVMRMTSVPTGGDRPQTGLFTVPSLQRKCAACEEEEKIQRAEMEEEEHLQRKEKSTGGFGGNEPIVIQRKCAACEEEEKVQRQEIDEEEPIQTKPLMRKAEGGGYTASPQLHSQLNSSKGGGNPLPAPTLASMNQVFGTDFSSVRIHTDSQAAAMSQGIQAKAFTYGGDIYFNRGQYSPETGEGKRLLGHELTHVVQQNDIVLKRKPQFLSAPIQISRQGGTIGPTVVHAIQFSCPKNAQKTIQFYTNKGVYVYDLVYGNCDENTNFDYMATVTIVHGQINLYPYPPAGQRYTYFIPSGAPDPSTFFNGQPTVKVLTGKTVPQPGGLGLGVALGGSGIGKGPSKQLVCARPLQHPIAGRLANHSFLHDYMTGANYAIDHGAGLVSGNALKGCATKTNRSPAPDTPHTSTCKPCLPKSGQTENDVSLCLENSYLGYAQPNVYQNFPDPLDRLHWGPNSNSFAATLAKCCADSSSSGLGNVPGWNHSPAKPCNSAAPGTSDVQHSQLSNDACFNVLRLSPGINARWQRSRSPIRGQTTVSEAAFRLDRGINPPAGQGTTADSRRWVRAIGHPKDDAGHVIANRFGGRANFNSPDGNIFPQDLSYNRGTMRSYDSVAADLHQRGSDVCVHIVLIYDPPTDLRPSAGRYTYLYRSAGASTFNPPIEAIIPNP